MNGPIARCYATAVQILRSRSDIRSKNPVYRVLVFARAFSVSVRSPVLLPCFDVLQHASQRLLAYKLPRAAFNGISEFL